MYVSTSMATPRHLDCLGARPSTPCAPPTLVTAEVQSIGDLDTIPGGRSGRLGEPKTRPRMSPRKASTIS